MIVQAGFVFSNFIVGVVVVAVLYLTREILAMLRPFLAPNTTTAVVVIFLIFFLFQREDLRNRFIRLAGSDDLERTTAALDDAGRRLSKLFLTQLVLNAIFGYVIGLGLAIIGVPSAPLWGLLATILRFVPYIGAIMAAALPIAPAAAVGSDWTMAIWTTALFAVLEPLMGQVVEPLVCGRTAGLSPVAIVVAASFWTWLWGPWDCFSPRRSRFAWSSSPGTSNVCSSST